MVSLIDKKPKEILDPLFERAKTTDEFEFCCSLLRVRGIEPADYDTLRESYLLAQQIFALMQASIENSLHLRLSLFLYCHFTEMSDLYNIVANLIRITMGQRYSMDSFHAQHHSAGKTAIYPSSKVPRLAEWAVAAGFPDVAKLFETMFLKQVRNAFFHSDYALARDGFVIRQGEGVVIDRITTNVIPLDWLGPRIELGINIALAVIGNTIDYIKSYTNDKIVKGRIGPNNTVRDVQLLTKAEQGLVGFVSPPKNSKDI